MEKKEKLHAFITKMARNRDTDTYKRVMEILDSQKRSVTKSAFDIEENPHVTAKSEDKKTEYPVFTESEPLIHMKENIAERKSQSIAV